VLVWKKLAALAYRLTIRPLAADGKPRSVSTTCELMASDATKRQFDHFAFIFTVVLIDVRFWDGDAQAPIRLFFVGINTLPLMLVFWIAAGIASSLSGSR
jgi:hypothetical protein